MKFVFVLEDDPKFQKQIVETIDALDPKIEIRIFSSLEEFLVWIRALVANGPGTMAKAGTNPRSDAKPVSETEEHQLVAIVSKIEFLGVRQLPLLKKTRNMFIARKVCTAEDPTSFVLTTFETPTFKIKELEDRILNNVIMKPFDRLILAQHLTFAIDGRHAPSKYSIANQKMETTIEMLKDVEMEGWSEIGFVTRSNRKLDLKQACSKYYGDLFKSERKTSLMARSMSAEADPKKPSEFICGFSYFGLSQTQILSIRRKVNEAGANFEFDWKPLMAQTDREARPLSIVLVEESETQALELMDSLRKRVKSTEVVHYLSEHAFFKELDPQLLELDPEHIKEEPPPAFPKDNELTFLFDESGSRLLDVIKEKADPALVWGVPDSEFRNHVSWWSHNLQPEQTKKFKDWLTNKNDLVLTFTIQKIAYYFKPTTHQKDEQNKQHKVCFQELTTEERFQLFVANGRVPKIIDLVIYSHRFLKPADAGKWAEVNKRLKARSAQNGVDREAALFVLSSKDYNDQEMRSWGQFALDIFYRPVDRQYFLQKLKLFFPEIQATKEPLEFHNRVHKEMINTANPVRVTEISEAGLVMNYYRPISHGSFREFVLWQAYELGSAKVLGSCNHSEDGAEKGVFRNHFVFFAIADHFLKAIRIWIRENYILNKDKE